MCGRLTNQFTWRKLVEAYRTTEPYLAPLSNLHPRFNFAPTGGSTVTAEVYSGHPSENLRTWWRHCTSRKKNRAMDIARFQVS